LRQRGIISIRGRRAVVHDLDALHRLASLETGFERPAGTAAPLPITLPDRHDRVGEAATRALPPGTGLAEGDGWAGPGSDIILLSRGALARSRRTAEEMRLMAVRSRDAIARTVEMLGRLGDPRADGR
jgi:hypothetical protein